MQMQLSGKVAVVTGAAGRIGKVLARYIYEQGAAVVAVDMPGKNISADVAAWATAGRPAVAIPCDITDPASVAELVEKATAAVGQVDVLINCHGLATNYGILDVTPEQWDKSFAINARGNMLLCQGFGRQWVERGVKGAIVNVSSGAATSSRAGNAHYAGSKAALNMLNEHLAIELGPYGIRSNVVSPGVVMDRVITGESSDQHEYLNAMWRATPLRRTGEPLDIAKACAFLASDDAAWISGVVLPVSGGSHCGRTHVPLTPIEKLV